jgi:hypothetical protein
VLSLSLARGGHHAAQGAARGVFIPASEELKMHHRGGEACKWGGARSPRSSRLRRTWRIRHAVQGQQDGRIAVALPAEAWCHGGAEAMYNGCGGKYESTIADP